MEPLTRGQGKRFYGPNAAKLERGPEYVFRRRKKLRRADSGRYVIFIEIESQGVGMVHRHPLNPHIHMQNTVYPPIGPNESPIICDFC